MTRITDERLKELVEHFQQCTEGLAEDPCEDTAAALRELQQFRLQAAMCCNCGGTRGPDHDCPALEGL